MKTKKSASIRLVLLLAILILINILSSFMHFRWDLTEGHRYTLTPSTVSFLQSVNGDVKVQVFLKGDFPASFKRLAEETRLTLADFKNIMGKRMNYEFINPLQDAHTQEEKEKIYKELSNRGITPTQLQVSNDDSKSSSIIFPKALVYYNGKEIPVNLLEERMGLSGQEQLNISESLLEYKFSKAISMLGKADKDRVVIVTGQNEQLGWNTYEAMKTLDKFYQLDTVDLAHTVALSNAYKAAIIIKPSSPFSEQDKFKLDQYVMNGGRIIWFVEKMFSKMESLSESEATMAMAEDLNIDDILFKYGVRLNADYIQDLSCNPIPVIIGESQGVPKTELKPWIYYPVVLSDSKHPISHNLDAISTEFTSSLDTIENDIKKTVLLHSSQYSRVMPSPVRISLSILKYPLDEKMFNNPNQPLAVLLEGKFHSLYTNRIPESFLQIYKDSFGKEFQSECKSDNKMIIVSDADMIMNGVSTKNGPMPWGYYQFTQQHFANPEFVLNCIDYLVDDNNIIESRSKDIPLRLLDPRKTKDDRLMMQVINIGVPIMLVLFFGSAFFFFRKRRYKPEPIRTAS